MRSTTKERTMNNKQNKSARKYKEIPSLYQQNALTLVEPEVLRVTWRRSLPGNGGGDSVKPPPPLGIILCTGELGPTIVVCLFPLSPRFAIGEDCCGMWVTRFPGCCGESIEGNEVCGRSL